MPAESLSRGSSGDVKRKIERAREIRLHRQAGPLVSALPAAGEPLLTGIGGFFILRLSGDAERLQPELNAND